MPGKVVSLLLTFLLALAVSLVVNALTQLVLAGSVGIMLTAPTSLAVALMLTIFFWGTWEKKEKAIT